MMYEMSYVNSNGQYNYTKKFQNQNYFSAKHQSDLSSMYRTNSTYSNISKTPKMEYEGDYFQPKNKHSGNKKKVKFNEKVIIIPVESYKEYNKIEDDININKYIDGINRQNVNQKKPKSDKCECNLI